MTLLESLVSLALAAGVATITFDLAAEVESKVVDYQASQIEIVKNYRSKIYGKSSESPSGHAKSPVPLIDNQEIIE